MDTPALLLLFLLAVVAAASETCDCDDMFDDTITHLNVESLGILSTVDHSVGSGDRLAVISSDGGISAVKQLRFDDNQLKLPGLSSFSPSGIMIHSDLNLNGNSIRNFTIEPETELNQVQISDSILTDVAIRNATATDLTLEDVAVDTLKVGSLAAGRNDDRGAIVGVSADGELVAQDAILIDQEELLLQRNVRVDGSIDMANHPIENAVFSSGSIDGDSIDISVRSVKAESIALQEGGGRQGQADSILLVADDGNIKRGSILMDDGGWLQDAKVSGTINFQGIPQEDRATGQSVQQQGRILNAHIEGGTLNQVESMTVAGGVDVVGDLNVEGDVLFHGGLSVAGSVLGTGPYIDVSDVRLKTNIESVGAGVDIIDALTSLQAVSYELRDQRIMEPDPYRDALAHDLMAMGMAPPSPKRRQIGFLAQDVLDVFPDLVSFLDEEGYMGVQYARFVPLLVESIKVLRDDNAGLRQSMKRLEQRVVAIEEGR
mmetsp:Transcript_1119/g.3160  ORF Transcript_1119/g.3160 Transcript_1119/m.3160 type:complete len:489 (-) Transcript_1119:1466-2932(-)